MNKFNIGDKVRTLRDFYFDLESGKYAILKGVELRVAIITNDGYGFENYDITLFIAENDLELLEEDTRARKVKVKSDIELFEVEDLEDTQEGETEEKTEMPEGRFVYKVNMSEFDEEVEYIHFENLTVLKSDIQYMLVEMISLVEGIRYGKGIIVKLIDGEELPLVYPTDDACYKDFRQAQKQLYPKVSELI